MSPETDNTQKLISKYKTMDIEELEANIHNWDKENDFLSQTKSLKIAKKELELKYKERLKQIELLTKNLLLLFHELGDGFLVPKQLLNSF